MSVQTTTHLNFQGQARAALAFYQDVVQGQATMFSYADMGHVRDPADADRIVWGQVTAENGFRVMAYDVPTGMPWHAGENAFFVSLRCDTAQEAEAMWGRLADGASILHALAPAQWSPLYGMLKDRFGVTWVVDVAVPYAG
jgi:PhnB protein